jgi:hypothetical protein
MPRVSKYQRHEMGLDESNASSTGQAIQSEC